MTPAETRETLIPAEFRAAVEIDPARIDGAPVVRGTRLPVAFIRTVADRGNTDFESVIPGTPAVTVQAAVDFDRFLDRTVC